MWNQWRQNWRTHWTQGVQREMRLRAHGRPWAKKRAVANATDSLAEDAGPSRSKNAGEALAGFAARILRDGANEIRPQTSPDPTPLSLRYAQEVGSRATLSVYTRTALDAGGRR